MLTDTLAALGRGHLSSVRQTVGRRLETGGADTQRLTVAGQAFGPEAWDRVGLLRDITTLVSQEKVNIASVITTEHEDSSASIYLTLYTTGVGQLSRLFSRLEGVVGVFSVTRSAPEEERILRVGAGRSN